MHESGSGNYNESGEDEEVTHFVQSKNIGTQNKRTLLFGKTR